MEFFDQIELFSRTPDNRFVFNLFDLLLCGVIVLVILRGWRTGAVASEVKGRLFLLLAFSCLGASFALGAVLAGAFFFFRQHYPEGRFDLLIHTLWVSAWLMLLASADQRPGHGQLPAESSGGRHPLSSLSPAALWLLIAGLPASLISKVAGAPLGANFILDVLNLSLLGLALIRFYRRPLGRHNFALGALTILFVAVLLHLASSVEMSARASTIIWSLEQVAWSFALFTFALAVSELSHDLFDRVFVGLQITFILLAGLMILVIMQTEKAEYLAGLRGRSNPLVEFVRANVDYLGQNEKLPRVIEREDFLQRAMLGFGHIPELKVVRVTIGSDVATYEIADDGQIQPRLGKLYAAKAPPPLNDENYFLIHALPLLEVKSGAVEFYGTREVLDRHLRKRILIIFSLFTGMVILSTFMIGIVVRGASRTIRQQQREIEETQQRLLEASKLAAIGQLAAGVAHEINNPATTILSRATLLLTDDQACLSASDREDLGAIVAESQRIARITGDLLLFSRPQGRRARPVALDHVVEESLRLVREPLQANGISVESALPAALPRVRADEPALIRALENLYRNALDAMPDGGLLRVRAARDEREAGRLRLEISDTGTGIDREDMARIFDPFFTTKEVGKGTGLGLSIVHGIIEEHQGTIRVESRPGKGTTFVITLPTEE